MELPPLSEFLPPLDSINLPPLNEFLKKVGLPSWEEMNLPPLSEFMKPVFDPQVCDGWSAGLCRNTIACLRLVSLSKCQMSSMQTHSLQAVWLSFAACYGVFLHCLQPVELPSLNAIISQANETFMATLKDILGDIPLPPGVKLPELKLPPLPNVRSASACCCPCNSTGIGNVEAQHN